MGRPRGSQHGEPSLFCYRLKSEGWDLAARGLLSASLRGHLLRPAQQSRALHSSHWPQWPIRTKGCGHQLREDAREAQSRTLKHPKARSWYAKERRHPHPARHRAVGSLERSMTLTAGLVKVFDARKHVIEVSIDSGFGWWIGGCR